MRPLLAVAGIAALGYGAYGWFTQDGARPLGQLVFLASVLFVHDFVVLPLAIVVGALVVRFAPAWARIPAQAALFISATTTVVALPFVIGAGRIADNPSAFPQHYGRGLVLVVTVVWVVAVFAAVLNRRRRRE